MNFNPLTKQNKMNAREYIPDWLSKKYWDVKEIGDWTPEDVVEFAEAYHKQATPPTGTVTDEEIEKEAERIWASIIPLNGGQFKKALVKWMRDKANTPTK